MKNILSFVLVLGLIFSGIDTFAGFGGSRGGSRSSGFSSSRGSSFGGSRSSGSSFGGSRSAPSRPSNFGGSRGSSKPAPIVRSSPPSSSSSSSHSSSRVEHHYYGEHPYYSPYGGNGFVHGFMWGQFFNRPPTVYVGGNTYVAGQNGQPMLSPDGQPIIYESHPFLSLLSILLWLSIIGGVIYLIYRFNKE